MDLHELNLTELKQIAKEKNITNISRFNKDALIVEIEKAIKLEETQAAGSTYKLTNDGDEIIEGILEVMPDGYGFLRGHNY